jgi:hypothetical protein
VLYYGAGDAIFVGGLGRVGRSGGGEEGREDGGLLIGGGSTCKFEGKGGKHKVERRA